MQSTQSESLRLQSCLLPNTETMPKFWDGYYPSNFWEDKAKRGRSLQRGRIKDDMTYGEGIAYHSF